MSMFDQHDDDYGWNHAHVKSEFYVLIFDQHDDGQNHVHAMSESDVLIFDQCVDALLLHVLVMFDQ